MFVCIVLALLFVSEAQAGCPGGWVQHDESCYHLSHVAETWFDAETVCKIFGGYLAEIDSARENNFINNLLLVVKAAAWIGASDLFVDGEWIWTHSRQQVSYTHWSPGEPNGNTIENCAEIYVGGVWNDNPCRNLKNYVCEMSVSGEAAVVG